MWGSGDISAPWYQAEAVFKPPCISDEPVKAARRQVVRNRRGGRRRGRKGGERTGSTQGLPNLKVLNNERRRKMERGGDSLGGKTAEERD